MKRSGFLFLLMVVFSISGHAYVERNILQEAYEQEDLFNSLVLGQAWVAYPDYQDRGAWDDRLGDLKSPLIVRGEKHLDYQWKVVKATDYLEFERSGSRQEMGDVYYQNINALSALVVAELAEGEGRFMDQIINGIWLFSEMTAWASSAHLPAFQASGRSLPDDTGITIDLASGDLSFLLAWTYYFFKSEVDEVHPYVMKRLRNELQIRVMDTYMERDDFWWQGFEMTAGQEFVNNWNPWCNSNVLGVFLLLENDPAKLTQAVYRTMQSVDKFINYNKTDGACEEGPAYWGHAAGKLYDYLQLLSYATAGQVTVFNQPIIRNMGEYMAQSYIGDGWVINFADASAKGGGPAGVIYRYGRVVQSEAMQEFAGYLMHRMDDRAQYIYSGRDIFRTLENITSHPELLRSADAEMVQDPFTWYPQTEFAYMRSDSGFLFAVKGGYNDESHNHNDVGTFILYYQNIPLFIDVGVGTYTRQTFSNERYAIWTMQSEYHNLPVINGKGQSPGRQFKSAKTQFSAARREFSLDMAQAYAIEAAVKEWNRLYQFIPTKGLTITDRFQLKQLIEPPVLNFMTHVEPELHGDGVIYLSAEESRFAMTYDAQKFDASTEEVMLTDPRLSNVWGERVYRLSLKAKDQLLHDEYVITIALD